MTDVGWLAAFAPHAAQLLATLPDGKAPLPDLGWDAPSISTLARTRPGRAEALTGACSDPTTLAQLAGDASLDGVRMDALLNPRMPLATLVQLACADTDPFHRGARAALAFVGIHARFGDAGELDLEYLPAFAAGDPHDALAMLPAPRAATDAPLSAPLAALVLASRPDIDDSIRHHPVLTGHARNHLLVTGSDALLRRLVLGADCPLLAEFSRDRDTEPRRLEAVLAATTGLPVDTVIELGITYSQLCGVGADRQIAAALTTAYSRELTHVASTWGTALFDLLVDSTVVTPLSAGVQATEVLSSAGASGRAAVLRRADLPREQLRQAMTLVTSPGTDEYTARVLAFWMADNPALPAVDQRRLAGLCTSMTWATQAMRLAANPSLDQAAGRALLSHMGEISEVALALAGNSRTPAATLDQIAFAPASVLPANPSSERGRQALGQHISRRWGSDEAAWETGLALAADWHGTVGELIRAGLTL